VIENHLYTCDDKLKWWGYGEWVEEADNVYFTHNEIECHVIRSAHKESNAQNFHIFGGHLCGYCRIPKDHPYYEKEYEEMNIDVYFALTFGEFLNNEYWIGFDCAHACDIIPSMQYLEKSNPGLIEIKKKCKELLKKININDNPKTYKNMNFVIEECKSIAEQLNAIK